MLQTGHQEGFGLEVADEVGLVGQARANLLDGDVATDGCLRGPVDDGERAFTQPLAQRVSPQGAAGPALGCPAGRDLLVEPFQPLGRFEPDLGQVRAEILECAEGLGLASRPGQHGHLLGTESLPQGELGYGLVHVGSQFAALAGRQASIDPCLDGLGA